MANTEGAELAKPKRKKAATKKEVLTDPVRNDGQEELEQFKGLARYTVPKEKDEWRLNELAIVLMDTVRLIRKHWQQMNAIAERSDEKTLAFSLAVNSVRKTTPPDVKVGLSFSESWRDSIKSKVPDPKQSTLPLNDEATQEASDPE